MPFTLAPKQFGNGLVETHINRGINNVPRRWTSENHSAFVIVVAETDIELKTLRAQPTTKLAISAGNSDILFVSVRVPDVPKNPQQFAKSNNKRNQTFPMMKTMYLHYATQYGATNKARCRLKFTA